MNIFKRIRFFFREFKFKAKHYYQKFLYGTSDYELWNLNNTIAKLILPKLRKFRNAKLMGTPVCLHLDENGGMSFLTVEEWRNVLDEIIFAFDFTLNEERYIKSCETSDFSYDWESIKKLNERREKGLKLFALYYNDLWD